MFESKSLMMNLFSLMLMPAETTSFIFRRYYMTRDDYKLVKVHTGESFLLMEQKLKFIMLTMDSEELWVPKGNHKIEFTYLPESFVIYKYLSLYIQL